MGDVKELAERLDRIASRVGDDNGVPLDVAPVMREAACVLSALATPEADPVAWMWEEVVDPTGEVIHGGTITRFATHASTPPSYADVTPLYRHPSPSITEAEVEAAAISDAEYDGRTFANLGRADKQRYLDRSRRALTAFLKVRRQG